MEKAIIGDILKKYAKQGDTFYTLSHGDVEFQRVTEEFTIVTIDGMGQEVIFNMYGELSPCGVRMLYPSESNRDWDDYIERHSTEIWQGNHVSYKCEQYVVSDISEDTYFLKRLTTDGSCATECIVDGKEELKKVDKFNFSQLKPFDRILVRDVIDGRWTTSLFSHISGDYFATANLFEGCVKYCIPYNDDTKHLVGKVNEEPDFYKK